MGKDADIISVDIGKLRDGQGIYAEACLDSIAWAAEILNKPILIAGIARFVRC